MAFSEDAGNWKLGTGDYEIVNLGARGTIETKGP
jgi:hypothetical protein